jgi:UDP-N-acetylmuramate: L-alanyl-gamma-D-glutamyl-meso-diaminopimelate ligase
LGIDDTLFYDAIGSFKGAARRLQTIAKDGRTHIFLDFAHSPSKLKATVHAVKEQYPRCELVACMELHTFSSLSGNLLAQYRGTMDEADEAWVYYNPKTIRHKKLPLFDREAVYSAFNGKNVEVFTDSKILVGKMTEKNWQNKNLLIMTSGNFDGIDFSKLAVENGRLSFCSPPVTGL